MYKNKNVLLIAGGGTEFVWLDTEEWLNNPAYPKSTGYWMELYDRFFDRTIDNTKVLKATGLTADDFLSLKEGRIIEIGKVLEELHGMQNS